MRITKQGKGAWWVDLALSCKSCGSEFVLELEDKDDIRIQK